MNKFLMEKCPMWILSFVMNVIGIAIYIAIFKFSTILGWIVIGISLLAFAWSLRTLRKIGLKWKYIFQIIFRPLWERKTQQEYLVEIINNTDYQNCINFDAIEKNN